MAKLTAAKISLLTRKHDGRHFQAEWEKWRKSLSQEDDREVRHASYVGGYDAAMRSPVVAALTRIVSATNLLSDSLDAWGPTDKWGPEDNSNIETVRDRLYSELAVINHVLALDILSALKDGDSYY
jgi:hypothetical protein